jgi:hypothetical protein
MSANPVEKANSDITHYFKVTTIEEEIISKVEAMLAGWLGVVGGVEFVVGKNYKAASGLHTRLQSQHGRLCISRMSTSSIPR